MSSIDLYRHTFVLQFTGITGATINIMNNTIAIAVPTETIFISPIALFVLMILNHDFLVSISHLLLSFLKNLFL